MNFQPELIIFVTLMVHLFFPKSVQKQKTITVLGCVGVLLSLFVSIVGEPALFRTVFGGVYQSDGFSDLLKPLVYFSALICLVGVHYSKELVDSARLDAAILILCSVLALNLLVPSTNLLVFGMGLQTISIAQISMFGLNTRGAKSSEAATKAYFSFALGDILLWIGIALFYSLGDSLEFSIIQHKAANISSNQLPIFWLAFAFVLAGFFSRVGIFPFQFPVADYLEGAPIPLAGFTLTAIYPILIFSMVRFFSSTLAVRQADHWNTIQGMLWPQVIAGAALISGLYFLLVAIFQANIKRRIASLIMSQLSLGLVAIMTLATKFLSALTIELWSTILASATTLLVVQKCVDAEGNQKLNSLRGLVWKTPILGGVFLISLLSLVGLPPLFGFTGKFLILSSTVDQRRFAYSFLLVLQWILCIPVVLPVLRETILKSDSDKGTHNPLFERFAFLSALPTLVCGINWNPLMLRVMDALSKVSW